MKQIPTALASHLAGPVTTIATCWDILPRDGRGFYFTDHDRDLVVDGTTYLSRHGYSRSALSSETALSVDSLDVEGLFEAEAITAADMRAGLFDHAEVRLFLVNWADPAMGRLRLRRGWLGEVIVTEAGQFRTELRGLTQVLQQQIGGLFSPECRADLGDARCKVDLGPLTQEGTVTTLEDRRRFICVLTTGPTRDDDWFAGGVLTWTSGPNAGRAGEIRTWASAANRLTLYLPPGLAISPGDGFRVTPGCDKRLVTCRTRFANALNFRGEPYLPGLDAVLRYPDAT
ncbi:DUF2163 domain-containing protein [Lutimaribacter sp. EGI FJ00015]|uniref:DUF2163 domain-containing protein n=1 Tax=Lutimaribacter degradans TaxID=2945989 RepID=A0ACC5ZZJ5_9RHOB|nr:DUF2163 domain-containing protein [Lutimaribacter sp. EGI FJ00013]MCM2563783.1 DUF2163 domain-containing protein [Lutimaribacter sp. EGI FJ00013]MCO0614970.1 DUF2163 domain-containing protein [Lutimaribacter sp. EGI FJ00015]MCO0637638.1 DUF2163 domain-containing protein [Lutimaribacter sp. EGI FJ00014]